MVTKLEYLRNECAQKHRTLVFDGGLGSELERRGADVSHALWSARALVDAPEIVSAIHRDYIDAGARVIATDTYQATVEGFQRIGFSESEAKEVMRSAVRLARQAQIDSGREVLVLLSCGPFGAALADGSEYRGDDLRTEEELYRFHAARLEVFRAEIENGVLDGVEFSTIPSLREVRAILKLMQDWAVDYNLSVSHSSPATIADGTPLVEVVKALETVQHRPVFLGSNCTPPEWTSAIAEEWVQGLKELKGGVGPSLLLYPNLGGTYDAETKEWSDATVNAHHQFFEGLEKAIGMGVLGVGGCCRTQPRDIEMLVKRNAN